MPIYEYQCESCGNIVENWQKITDPPLKECEQCGGPMKKLISQSSFHLKGSGWYVTDYASKKTGNASTKKNAPGDKAAVKKKTVKKTTSSAGSSSADSSS